MAGGIACPSAGDCVVVGSYSAAYNEGFIYYQPFVATQAHGTWTNAIEVPGIKTLSLSVGQESAATAISCTAPGRCSIGGYNSPGPNFSTYAFVDSRP